MSFTQSHAVFSGDIGCGNPVVIQHVFTWSIYVHQRLSRWRSRTDVSSYRELCWTCQLWFERIIVCLGSTWKPTMPFTSSNDWFTESSLSAQYFVGHLFTFSKFPTWIEIGKKGLKISTKTKLPSQLVLLNTPTVPQWRGKTSVTRPPVNRWWQPVMFHDWIRVVKQPATRSDKKTWNTSFWPL